MENSPLNQAHQQQRRAEALLPQKKFDECIECHKNAISLLMESLTLTDNQKSQESLKLQKLFHEKEIEVVRLKRSQYENFKKVKKTSKPKDTPVNIVNENEYAEEDALKTAIFHNIVVQDSLIDRLEKRHNGSDYDSFSTSDTDEKNGGYDKIDSVPTNAAIGNKRPKDDFTTIEELRILRGQLQELVHILVTQLDERNKEIEKLKLKIRHLECDRNKGSSKTNSLKVVTDSSGGTSPYVFSPGSESSPDVNEMCFLPSLAPLDLPKFEYNQLYKNHPNSANQSNNNSN